MWSQFLQWSWEEKQAQSGPDKVKAGLRRVVTGRRRQRGKPCPAALRIETEEMNPFIK